MIGAIRLSSRRRKELPAQLQAALGTAYMLEPGGGTSRVFVAEETRLGRKVVMKFVSEELASSVSIERFRREMRLRMKVGDDNVVQLTERTMGVRGVFLTYQYVHGQMSRVRQVQQEHQQGPGFP